MQIQVLTMEEVQLRAPAKWPIVVREAPLAAILSECPGFPRHEDMDVLPMAASIEKHDAGGAAEWEWAEWDISDPQCDAPWRICDAIREGHHVRTHKLAFVSIAKASNCSASQSAPCRTQCYQTVVPALTDNLATCSMHMSLLQ